MRPALLLCFCLPASLAVAKEKAATPVPAPQSRSSQVIGQPDMSRVFPMEQLTRMGGTNNTYGTKSARSDGFYFQQKFQPKGYAAKDFRAQGWWGGDFKFATNGAATKGKYEVPNAAKAVPVKAKDVKDATETGKAATVRDLPDGSRQFLGKESRKMQKPLDPTNLPKITNEMHELKTIEDVKDLLNKNR